MKAEERLIVALDVDTLDKAREIVKILHPVVKTFKIGSQLFTSAGPEALTMVHACGCRVFLDLKFHDIPNTVAAASRAAAGMGVFMFNVHTFGGKEMLETAVQAVKDKKDKPILLGVTVLTSISRPQLNSLGIMRSVKKEVGFLAKLAKECGLDGVVCSANEVELIKRLCGKYFLTVVPGVRPQDSNSDDQKRTATPRQAIENGADFIVVGRPIIAGADPLKSAEEIIREIK